MLSFRFCSTQKICLYFKNVLGLYQRVGWCFLGWVRSQVGRSSDQSQTAYCRCSAHPECFCRILRKFSRSLWCPKSDKGAWGAEILVRGKTAFDTGFILTDRERRILGNWSGPIYVFKLVFSARLAAEWSWVSLAFFEIWSWELTWCVAVVLAPLLCSCIFPLTQDTSYWIFYSCFPWACWSASWARASTDWPICWPSFAWPL